MRYREWFLCAVALLVGASSALAQTTVRPAMNGEGFEISNDGTNFSPFFPLGWQWVGIGQGLTVGAHDRTDIVGDLNALRAEGVNFIWETQLAGSWIPEQPVNNHFNYLPEQFDSARPFRAMLRPLAMVEGIRWLLQTAYGDGTNPIYLMVSLDGYIQPYDTDKNRLTNDPTEPVFHGHASMSCDNFRDIVLDHERDEVTGTPYHAAFGAEITAFSCAGRADRPLWEWMIVFVVDRLRGESGLFGWQLWDEPEGVANTDIFGRLSRTQRPREWVQGDRLDNSATPTNATPDLLRYTYDLIKSIDDDHPVVVEYASAKGFFAFNHTERDDTAPSSGGYACTGPCWHHNTPILDSTVMAGNAGPFDVTPVGAELPNGTPAPDIYVPADIIAVDASATFRIPSEISVGSVDYHAWISDGIAPAYELTSKLENGHVWGLMVLGQASLSGNNGSSAACENDPSPCSDSPYGDLEGTNPDQDNRLLNERDIQFQAIASLIDNAQGYFYYALPYLRQRPTNLAGDDQLQATMRMLELLGGSSGLTQVASSGVLPMGSWSSINQGWDIDAIQVNSLTHYVRTPQGNLVSTPPQNGLSNDSQSATESYFGYTIAHYNRFVDGGSIGHARKENLWPYPGSQVADYERRAFNFLGMGLLRQIAHRPGDGWTYLFFANAFDASITVDLEFERDGGPTTIEVSEGLFNLSAGSFSWGGYDIDEGSGTHSSSLAMAPYEARVLRYRHFSAWKSGEGAPAESVMDFALHTAAPNPATGLTEVRYSIPEATYVNLALYDMLGREVTVLVDGTAEPGEHLVRLDATKLPAGVYLARLSDGRSTRTSTIVVRK